MFIWEKKYKLWLSKTILPIIRRQCGESFEFVQSALSVPDCLLVCWCFVCVGMSLFYHCVLLRLHLFIHVCVCVCVWEREREMRRMADWPDAVQEASGTSGVSEEERGGNRTGWSVLLTLYNTHWLTQITMTCLITVDPCAASTRNTNTHVWDYKWRNGHCFSFCCPKWTRRSLSFTAAGKWQTQSSVCIDSRGLSSPCPIICARFHFSSFAAAERKRWSRRLSRPLKLTCRENRIYCMYLLLDILQVKHPFAVSRCFFSVIKRQRNV